MLKASGCSIWKGPFSNHVEGCTGALRQVSRKAAASHWHSATAAGLPRFEELCCAISQQQTEPEGSSWKKLKEVFLNFSLFLLKYTFWFWSYYLSWQQLLGVSPWESSLLPCLLCPFLPHLKAFWKTSSLAGAQIPDGGSYYQMRNYGNSSVWAERPELNCLSVEILEFPAGQIPACRAHGGKAQGLRAVRARWRGAVSLHIVLCDL